MINDSEGVSTDHIVEGLISYQSTLACVNDVLIKIV